MIIVQLGACYGDDHVSKFYNDDNQIVLVEANEMHIRHLKDTYPAANVIHAAIVPDQSYGKTITMYYSTDDSPHYEITSTDQDHLFKHGKSQESIRSFQSPTMTLSALLDSIWDKVDILFVDIEGLDEDVLKATPLAKYDIDKIQVEMLHLKDKASLLAYMDEQGYELTDDSYDRFRYDRVFVKKQL
jgi:FkbM family methyltransferase